MCVFIRVYLIIMLLESVFVFCCACVFQFEYYIE